MKDIFSPIFLTGLLLLAISHHFDAMPGMVTPFLMLSFPLALALFFLKKFKWSYALAALSISLLLSLVFLQERTRYTKAAAHDIPGDQYISVYGELTDFPDIRRNDSIVCLRSTVLEYRRQSIPAALNIRIKVQGELKNLNRGDFVRVNARLSRNRLNRNFYENPYENFLFTRGIHFNGYCKSPQMVFLQKRATLPWRLLGSWRRKLREVVENRYTDAAGQLDRKGVFLEAILLGDRGKLNPEQRDELLDSGVYHLLAISGAHIGIIAIFSLVLLKILRVEYRKRYVITGLLLIGFLAFSGFKISAQRAVLMAIFIFAARILYDDIDIFNIISFSGLIILFLNPPQFLDAGFILTFTLTAAIAVGRKIFNRVLGFFPTYFRELLSANISASLIALPLSLFFFKRYSFAGILSGLLLLPLTAVITALGILLIPVALVSDTLPGVLLTVIDVPLTLFFTIVGFFSETVDLSIFRASPPLPLVLFILIFFVLAARENGPKMQKRFFGTIFCAALLFLILDPFRYNPRHLEVFFLDVGQGDAACAVFPGGQALLIDGGGSHFSDFQVGRNLVLPFLLQKRIRVKWAALSHYHPDHCRGMVEIVNILKPRELWISSQAGEDTYFKKLLETLHPSVKIRKITSRFRRRVGECRIRCLYPEKFIVSPRTHNNHSQVLKISDRYHAFLFTGDIEREIEQALTRDHCPDLESDVLKVPHHGSRTSSTPGFLECVAPQMSVFSYGYRNRFGFPHPGVLQDYRGRKVKTFSTANRGGIKITSLPTGLTIETSR